MNNDDDDGGGDGDGNDDDGERQIKKCYRAMHNNSRLPDTTIRCNI